MMIVNARNLDVSRPADGSIVVNLPLRGTIKTDRGVFSADVTPQSADVTNGNVPMRLQTELTTTMVVRFDSTLLTDVGTSLMGGRAQPELRFDRALNLRTAEGQAWLLACHRYWSYLKADTGRRQSSGVREIDLASDFLLAATSAGTAALDEHDDVPNLAALKKVEDWIMVNLAESITRSVLCGVSDLHVRTLTRGFQVRYGVSPMQFVRNQRLDVIRSILLSSNPQETSVTMVAEDYGMWHLGRFAQEYRSRFHERPVDTLSG